MTSGLIAILDDITALAKIAAASLDDAGTQAVKATGKAAGIVIDDAAVTPRYVVGLSADRELPIIRKIAWGSLKNKLLYLLPAALLLSVVAPWAITPLLMAGGAFLCLEGYHKVRDLFGHGHESAEAESDAGPQTPEALEDERVTSAIRTDFILSAEIMAITLGSVAEKSLWMQATVLAVVGVGMTILVYGAVALIVKADDMGVALAQTRTTLVQKVGRGVVIAMPHFLKTLSLLGMFAMLWVGGGILLHGVGHLGWHGPHHHVQHMAQQVGSWLPAVSGGLAWFAEAFVGAVLGVIIGALVDPVVRLVASLRKK